MLESQLGHVVVVVQQVVAAFFPDIGIARGGATLGRVAGQATVQGVVVAHEIAFEDDARGVIDLPAEHRRDVVALGLHVVAEGFAAFAEQVQTVGQAAVFAERAGGVEGGAVHALVIELAAKVTLGSARGCLLTALKVPPGSPRPYRLVAGPRSTSRRSTVLASGAFG